MKYFGFAATVNQQPITVIRKPTESSTFAPRFCIVSCNQNVISAIAKNFLTSRGPYHAHHLRNTEKDENLTTEFKLKVSCLQQTQLRSHYIPHWRKPHQNPIKIKLEALLTFSLVHVHNHLFPEGRPQCYTLNTLGVNLQPLCTATNCFICPFEY